MILLACLLVQQCVSRYSGTGDRPARSAENPVKSQNERPSALSYPRAGDSFFSASSVAAIAASLPKTLGASVGGELPASASVPVIEPRASHAPPANAVDGTAVSDVAPVEARTQPRELDALEPFPMQEPAPFVDQYLIDDGADMGVGFRSTTSGNAGRRFVEAELIYYDSSDDFLGSETEKGLRTRWRQETLNWGEIDAQLVFSDIESDFLGRDYQSDEIFFTLRQTNAPLDNGWLMNNTAGHQRTLIDPFLHSGYRIRLPTSLFLGVSMAVTTDLSSGQWYMGKTGDNLGIAVPQFRENGGEILGGSWRRSVAGDFLVGAEIVDVKGNELVRDHTSLLAAGRYSSPDSRAQHDVHLLTDDDANVGIWADGRNLVWSDLVMRYGGFYLEPQLAWMDRPIVNDQYGAYLRADKRSYVYNYSIGYDYTKAGLDESSMFEAEHNSLFVNGNYRLSRQLSIGANGNLMFRDFSSTTEDSQVAWRINNFINYRFPTGLGRFELYASQLDSDFMSNNSDLYGARVSYDWDLPQGYRLTTEALVEEQRRLSFDNSNQRLSVLFRQDIASNLSWGVNTSLYRNDDELLNTSTGFGINADARWQFLRDWYVSASVVHNQSFIDPAASNLVGGETDFQTDSVWLRFGYAHSSGQAFRRYGRSSGGVGAGSIRGTVYYDENRDLVRQPGEHPAAGVVVVIDGRYETRTDAQGRYEFDPVYPGPHRVSLVSADLPLPWGLDDEAPQTVEVGIRQTSDVDFGLVDLGGG